MVGQKYFKKAEQTYVWGGKIY